MTAEDVIDFAREASQAESLNVEQAAEIERLTQKLAASEQKAKGYKKAAASADRDALRAAQATAEAEEAAELQRQVAEREKLAAERASQAAERERQAAERDRQTAEREKQLRRSAEQEAQREREQRERGDLRPDGRTRLSAPTTFEEFVSTFPEQAEQLIRERDAREQAIAEQVSRQVSKKIEGMLQGHLASSRPAQVPSGSSASEEAGIEKVRHMLGRLMDRLDEQQATLDSLQHEQAHLVPPGGGGDGQAENRARGKTPEEPDPGGEGGRRSAGDISEEWASIPYSTLYPLDKDRANTLFSTDGKYRNTMMTDDDGNWHHHGYGPLRVDKVLMEPYHWNVHEHWKKMSDRKFPHPVYRAVKILDQNRGLLNCPEDPSQRPPKWAEEAEVRKDPRLRQVADMLLTLGIPKNC